MPDLKCKQCKSPYNLSRNLYDLKASREAFVNLVQSNIITWTFKEPFPEVERYLNKSVTSPSLPCTYMFNDWLSPKHGLIFFVESERHMTRKGLCKKCAFDSAAKILRGVLDGSMEYTEVNHAKHPVTSYLPSLTS